MLLRLHRGRTRVYKPNLVIAPGFAPFPLVWRRALTYYRHAGFNVISSEFRMRDMYNTVRYAESIARKIRWQYHAESSKRIDVIGFSMGAVAMLYAIKRLDIAHMVRTFIAVGGPFYGTPVEFLKRGGYLFTNTGTQLSPDSDFLSDLHRDPMPADGPRIACYCLEDDAVCPPLKGFLDFAHDHILRGRYTHLSLLWSKALHLDIMQVLRNQITKGRIE